MKMLSLAMAILATVVAFAPVTASAHHSTAHSIGTNGR